MTSAWRYLVCVLGGALLATAALWRGRPVSTPAVALDLRALEQRLERIEASHVRLEALQRHPSSSDGVPAPIPRPVGAVQREPERDEPAPLTPAQEQTERETARVVDVALARGAWQAADRDQWRQLAPQLDDEARVALMRKLAVALNRGELRVDLHGPLL
jgi:hypothetical protein